MTTSTEDGSAVPAEPVIIECNGCGHRLRLPQGFEEGAGFRCAHCGLWMRNVEAMRNFRWASFDSFTQKWGASKLNLIGGMLGSIIWLPILGIVSAAMGTFDTAQFTLLAVPYLLMIGLLMIRRARMPAALWVAFLWVGLGLYLLYVVALTELLPGGMFTSGTGPGTGSEMASLLPFGVVAAVVGVASIIAYRTRASRLPAISGDPPTASERGRSPAVVRSG